MMATPEWMEQAAVGCGLLVAWPLAKRFVLPRLVDFLVGQGVSLLLKGLRGDGIEDADLKAFEHDVVFAFVRLAEKKLPDTGLGQERRAWVEASIVKAFPWLKGREQDLADAIEKAVIRMDVELKSMSRPS